VSFWIALRSQHAGRVSVSALVGYQLGHTRKVRPDSSYLSFGDETSFESPSLCSVVMPAFPSTCCFLDKLANLFLDGGGQSVHGKGGRPTVTVVEVCVLLETERRVP
jgi:hypothetical protein